MSKRFAGISGIGQCCAQKVDMFPSIFWSQKQLFADVSQNFQENSCSRVFLTAWKVSVFGVFLIRIQSECSKIRTRKTPYTNTFLAVSLTHFVPLISFYTPYLSVFSPNDHTILMFPGVIERAQWLDMV